MPARRLPGGLAPARPAGPLLQGLERASNSFGGATRGHGALPWSTWLALGLAAAWALPVLELLVVLTIHGARISGVWELQFGVLWLLPILLAVGTALGLVGTGCIAVLMHGSARWRRLLWAAAWAIALSGAAYGATTGRLFEPFPRRAAVIAAAFIIGAALAYTVAPRTRRAALRHPRGLAGAAGILLIGLEVGNRFLLYRLYPDWHWALAGITLFVAPWLGFPLAWRPRGAAGMTRPSKVLVAASLAFLGVGLAAALLTPLTARRLAHFDNFRWLLVEQAPLSGHAVRLAAMVAPPPPLVDACSGPTACPTDQIAATPGAPQVNWRGRDVLLVTIDAVRADHVGAYGYERPTTPVLDRLASHGVRFEYAYAPTPHTSYSITSLMTGKYMRPLLLQGAGADSDTWAKLLRTYGYRTAAFYPPAVFFIDGRRFAGFSERFLDFEYRKVQFLEGEGRVEQVKSYLAGESGDRPQFLWVHLFGPHEPYESHAAHPFGPRDVDRYDAEIAAADRTLGELVGLFRRDRPDAVVIVASDHGEEFGDHGGRYHGTSVYEEQVRVPLVVNASGLSSTVVTEPVQTIDLLPTVLSALQIPRSARIRGRDLTPLLSGEGAEGDGFAFAETEEQSMLASGPFRLICQRRLGACQLYNVLEDPTQRVDVGTKWPEEMRTLRARLRQLSASHGRFERQGMRAEGKGWPDAVLRAVSGDADAITDLIPFLDDADLDLRRKAAELAFELKREEAAPALRLALARDEDEVVRRWAALALTRLGQGAPLAYELVDDEDRGWRRLAALALAEVGDARGADILIEWWRDSNARDHDRSRQLLAALGRIRARDAVWPLLQSLGDVRLRPYVAEALAEIGDEAARGALAKALASERYQGARIALARAIVDLGGEGELVGPLVRFLGVPDALPGGVGMGIEADILEYIGGPDRRQLRRLAAEASLGALVRVVVPAGGNGEGVRLIVRGTAWQPSDGFVRIGAPLQPFRNQHKKSATSSRKLPEIDPTRAVELKFPVDSKTHELTVRAPAELGLAPRRSVELVVVTDRAVRIDALVAVPLADELPPPAPEPWHPAEEARGTAGTSGAGAASGPTRATH